MKQKICVNTNLLCTYIDNLFKMLEKFIHREKV